MAQRSYSAWLGVLFLGLVIVFGGILSSWSVEPVLAWIRMHTVAGALAYVFLLAASVVLLPLSSLPLVPIAGPIWGLWGGGILSGLGWWFGSLIAFALARVVGRPLVEKLVSASSLQKFERKVPKDAEFFIIVLLRMTLPVDIPSYLLGLLPGLPFRTYALASAIGIFPFAFVWVAVGNALFSGEWWLAVGLGMCLAGLVWGLRKL